jgi:phage N-6-adenine-methyltransferase
VNETPKTIRIGDRDIPLRDCWSTPEWLFERLDARWGFGLDAAATFDSSMRGMPYLGPDHIGVDRRDALSRSLSWAACSDGAPVFCNPPFSQSGGGLTRWVEAFEAQGGEEVPVVAILPDTPSCRWFRRAWESAYEVTLFDGRVAFVPPPGVKPSSPTGGVVVFAWVPHTSGPAKVRWESLPGRREVSDG